MKLFPWEVSCSVPKYGKIGIRRFYQLLCLLPYNALFQYIFWILWIYLPILSVLTLLQNLYLLALLLAPRIRQSRWVSFSSDTGSTLYTNKHFLSSDSCFPKLKTSKELIRCANICAYLIGCFFSACQEEWIIWTLKRFLKMWLESTALALGALMMKKMKIKNTLPMSFFLGHSILHQAIKICLYFIFNV